MQRCDGAYHRSFFRLLPPPQVQRSGEPPAFVLLLFHDISTAAEMTIPPFSLFATFFISSTCEKAQRVRSSDIFCFDWESFFYSKQQPGERKKKQGRKPGIYQKTTKSETRAKHQLSSLSLYLYQHIDRLLFYHWVSFFFLG